MELRMNLISHYSSRVSSTTFALVLSHTNLFWGDVDSSKNVGGSIDDGQTLDKKLLIIRGSTIKINEDKNSGGA